MINPKYYDKSCVNFVSLSLFDRQYGFIDRSIQRRLYASTALIDRLEQEAVLKGHEGCVNCLEWSSNGRILASGSDDFQVILWDPFRKRRLCSIRTKHLGNMFSVKFLPRHNDRLIATAAADKFIHVFDVNHYNDSILSCQCHTARVKRLATSLDSPYVFWSAGEDGVIMQLDIREQHRCRSDENRVRLLNLTTYLDSNAEAKCLAINPRRTELMAVGANDPYARLYDRRMLRPTSSFTRVNNGPLINVENTDTSRSTVPKDCVNYYCPGHINKNNSKIVEHESRAITYLTFNADGTELLVNMGGEHVYLYDTITAEQPIFLNLPEYTPPPDLDVEMTDIGIDHPANAGGDASTTQAVPLPQPTVISHRRKIPDHIESYKRMGNEYLENEKYLRAIEQYSEAIMLAPDCSVLYLNRATAYMRRLWFGDVYSALRDCHQALRLDPTYVKAQFRLARALLELGRLGEANECLQELISRFPSYKNNHGVQMLSKDIKENRQTTQTQQHANEAYSFVELSDEEFEWRSKARDYSKRFVGHCNTTTDIKEANYIGFDGKFIIAGSDDGNFFIWDRASGKIRAVYKADTAIVNCVQPHPDICMIATSGIDRDIKIWSPIATSLNERPNLVSYIDKTVEDNQQKMRTDPFDLNTRNTFCWSG